MNFDAYVFDLDGTLLNTLPDLVRLTNMVLAKWGFPERTTEEINSFVGGGGRLLLRRAAPADASDEQIDALFSYWQELYPEYGHQMTKPYQGIPEVLDELRGRGAKLAVLSNKYDVATRSVIARHFPNTFDIVRGECAEIPRKPDPAGLLWEIAALDVAPQRVCFVGDSGIDMETAVAASAYPVGVTWGYRPLSDLLAHGARAIANAPADLLDLQVK